jgi:hypothetical protein
VQPRRRLLPVLSSNFRRGKTEAAAALLGQTGAHKRVRRRQGGRQMRRGGSSSGKH